MIDFPSDADVESALPVSDHSWLRQYVVHGFLRLPTPAIYHLATGLSVLAATAPYRLRVGEHNFLRPVAPNLYSLVVGGSGAQKTLALLLGRDLLKAACPDLVSAEPGSEEALVASTGAQPVQWIMLQEFGAFLQATTGGSYREGLRKALTGAYEGEINDRNLKKGKVLTRDPQISMLCACTPVDLQNYTAAIDWEGGFLSRFFLAGGVRTRTQHLPVLDQARADWLLGWLYHVGRSSTVGACTGFTPAARDLWTAFNDEIEALRQASPERSSGVIGRTILQAAKVSALLAWDYGPMRRGEPWAMDLDVLHPAIAIARLHLKTALALIPSIAPTQEARELQEVLSSVPIETWISEAELLRRVPIQVRRLRSALGTLKARLQVEAVQQGAHAFWRQTPQAELPAFDPDLQAAPPPPPAAPPPGPDTSPPGQVIPLPWVMASSGAGGA